MIKGDGALGGVELGLGRIEFEFPKTQGQVGTRGCVRKEKRKERKKTRRENIRVYILVKFSAPRVGDESWWGCAASLVRNPKETHRTQKKRMEPNRNPQNQMEQTTISNEAMEQTRKGANP